MMDEVGLDTVAFMEPHYVAERGLPSDKDRRFRAGQVHQKGKVGRQVLKKEGCIPASRAF
jgi:hypothetical protein